MSKIDGLAQERHNSIANALELRLSCTNPSKWPVWLGSIQPWSMHLPNPLSHVAFVNCIGRHRPHHGDEFLKDEIQASNSENSKLKQKAILGNNDRVQLNATQRCNQPPVDTIVHWRNGWPGIGDVLSGTLNGWVRMMDDIALRWGKKKRVHPDVWASPRQIFEISPYFYRGTLC